MKPQVISNVDVYKTAHFLIQQRGGFARWRATQRARALLERGDIRGYETFTRVAALVEELERQQQPHGDKQVN